MLENLPFIYQGLIMFLCQVVFLAFRTLNVKGNADLNRWTVAWTGAIVHCAWFATLYIGLGNMFSGNPLIILFSLSGGLLGADTALRYKIKQKQ